MKQIADRLIDSFSDYSYEYEVNDFVETDNKWNAIQCAKIALTEMKSLLLSIRANDTHEDIKLRMQIEPYYRRIDNTLIELNLMETEIKEKYNK